MLTISACVSQFFDATIISASIDQRVCVKTYNFPGTSKISLPLNSPLRLSALPSSCNHSSPRSSIFVRGTPAPELPVLKLLIDDFALATGKLFLYRRHKRRAQVTESKAPTGTPSPTPIDVGLDIPSAFGFEVLAASAGVATGDEVTFSCDIAFEVDGILLVAGIDILVRTVGELVCKIVVGSVIVSDAMSLASTVLVWVCKAVTWTIVVVIGRTKDVEVMTVPNADCGMYIEPQSRPFGTTFRSMIPWSLQQPPRASGLDSCSPQHQGPGEDPFTIAQ